MTKEGLILAVAAHMDEVTAEGEAIVEVSTSDNNPLYSLINELLDESLMELFAVAPLYRLPQTAFPVENRVTKNDSSLGRKVIRVKVPDDFMRLVELDCDEFERPIVTLHQEGSAMAKRQHNRHLVAKTARPVGVIRSTTWTDSVYGREIDCYSLDGDGTNWTGSYVARPSLPVSLSESIPATTLPDILTAPLEWLCAAKVFGARGDANHAAICQQNATNLIV